MRRRTYPPQAAKVKQQLAAMEVFFGGRNGPGSPVKGESKDAVKARSAQRELANVTKP
jgi:hypothetical protein